MDELEIARKLARGMLANGTSFRKIAENFRQRGLCKRKWSHSQVKKLVEEDGYVTEHVSHTPPELPKKMAPMPRISSEVLNDIEHINTLKISDSLFRRFVDAYIKDQRGNQ